MTRKAKISFLVVVWTIVAIQLFVNYQQKNNQSQQAVTAFSLVNNQVIEEMVEGYGYFGTLDLTEEIKEKMLYNLADKMELDGDFELSVTREDNWEKMTLTCDSSVTHATIQFVSTNQENAENEEMEHYILMDIFTQCSLENGKDCYNLMKQVYEDIGAEGQVSMEVVLEKEGNLISASEVDIILQTMNAAKVGELCENGIYTVYGYTREENSYMLQNEEKVNVQIVMYYDEEADKTYIKIGIPMVNSGY